MVKPASTVKQLHNLAELGYVVKIVKLAWTND